MANKKRIGLQNRLEILTQALKDYQGEDGEVKVSAIGENPITSEPAVLVIHLPHVRRDGDKLVLVEYATNSATNENGHE